MLLLFVLFFFFRYPLTWLVHAHWRSFLFEESQTLSWFMHVYQTANTCNMASNPHVSFNRSPLRILSCHRYPVGRLLSFLLRALVSSGHTLQGQTCQDLAIKHSFHQRKPDRFPKLTDRFFWTLHSTPHLKTDRSFLRPGRFILLLLFDNYFQRQEATKIKGEKNSLI